MVFYQKYHKIDLQTRDVHVEESKTIHIVCYDIEDKPEIADKSAENILKLCQIVQITHILLTFDFFIHTLFSLFLILIF